MNKTKILKVSEIIFLSLIVMAIALNANAQHSTSSPYSRFGIGDIASKGNSQTNSMGGVNIGVRSPFSLNSSNPASYSALTPNTFLLDLGINYKSSLFKTSDAEQYNNDANITHFSFAFSANKWLYFSAGLKPFSYVGYDITNTTLNPDGFDDITSYTGSGGINKVYVGSSIKLFDKISIGVNINYLFGTVNKTSSTTTTTESGSSSVDISKSEIYKKFIPEFGVQYSDTLFGKNKFTLGFIFNKKNDINLTNEIITTNYLSIFGNAFNDTINYIEEKNSNFTMPTLWGVGFSYNFGDKLLLAVDYSSQSWSKSLDGSIGKFNFINENTIAVGLEYIPKLGGNKLHQNIRYRAGFYKNNSYLQADGNNINTMAVSFGFGLPFKNSRNVLNFSTEIGKKGTIDNNLLQENFTLFSVSISLHDYWFRKYKFN